MLNLSNVTLIAIDTINHALALRALARSCEGIRYARMLLLTDRLPADVAVPAGVEVVTIAPIASRDAYSQLVLKRMLPFVATSHALIVQWDGYAVNPAAWDPAFAACDYIGARWYWQPEGFRVGNGGFSLRSRRLLEALQDPRIVLTETEDLTIGHAFRPLLEREHGIRFADEPLADRFAFEAAHPIGKPFGFHGLFNFVRVMPAAELAALAPAFSDAIARSPQLAQLVKNALAAGMGQAALALAERRLRALPDDAGARALKDEAQRSSAQAPAAGRNDPCPCGSGKRYKHCHGAAGPSGPASSVAAAQAETPDTLVQRGLAAHRRGDLPAAERDYRAAVQAFPEHPVALHYLGVIAYQHRDLAQALPLLERAAALLPSEPEFHGNLGLALAAAGRTDDAIVAYRNALARKPDHATAWNNLGLALTAANALPAAIDALSRAVTLAPTFGEAHWNLALALLRHGDYARGWREYEWRLKLPTFHDASFPRTPRWTGHDLRGKTLLVVSEQGLGDTLHFIRFAALLAVRGVRVVAAVPAGLAQLVATVPGVAAVAARAAPWPGHDAWIPLLSLPGVLGLLAPPAHAGVPYVFVDDARRHAVAASLSSAAVLPRIGLAWAGAPANTLDHLRSCPLAALAPLLERTDVTWYSLQKGAGEAQIGGVPAAARLVQSDARNDFDGSAALIANLDLVISIDTSIAHLAGAIGRPVWILLPFACDWRWQDGRSDTPWYPSARLFRQSQPGDWAGVVQAVGAALDARGRG